jgi:hypothetical protein
MAVGMTLHRRFTESDFHLDFRAGASDSKNFVIVAFGHANVEIGV